MAMMIQHIGLLVVVGQLFSVALSSAGADLLRLSAEAHRSAAVLTDASRRDGRLRRRRRLRHCLRRRTAAARAVGAGSRRRMMRAQRRHSLSCKI